jgi:hypothetical protein
LNIGLPLSACRLAEDKALGQSKGDMIMDRNRRSFFDGIEDYSCNREASLKIGGAKHPLSCAEAWHALRLDVVSARRDVIFS